MSVKFIFIDKYSVIIGGLSTIAAAYAIYRLIKRYIETDEYCSSVNLKGDNCQRRVLVLGLVGAGKTRLLQCFQQQDSPDGELQTPTPTLGYNVVSTRMAGVNYHFFEGAFTAYWDVNSDVLVWVVDSSSPEAFQASRLALHSFVNNLDKLNIVESKDEQTTFLFGMPIIIVASKQDLIGCSDPETVYQAMQVNTLIPRHKVYKVGTHIPNKGQRMGLWRLYELVAYADTKGYSHALNI